MRDLHNRIKEIRVLSPVALTTTLSAAGKIVDLRGYEGCEFVMSVGTRTTTSISVTPIVLEGSVTSTLTSVADADLLGTEANCAIPAAASLVSGVNKNAVKRIGYIGNKRYVTVNWKPSAGTTMIGSVTALVGKASREPLAT